MNETRHVECWSQNVAGSSVITTVVIVSFLCFSLSPFPSSTSFLSFSNLFFILCWSMVDLQYCVSFRCTAKWIGYTYTYICSFSDSFPILVITEYWRLFFLQEGSFLKQCWQIQYSAKWRRYWLKTVTTRELWVKFSWGQNEDSSPGDSTSDSSQRLF